jgi:hypothetical protein
VVTVEKYNTAATFELSVGLISHKKMVHKLLKTGSSNTASCGVCGAMSVAQPSGARHAGHHCAVSSVSFTITLIQKHFFIWVLWQLLIF